MLILFLFIALFHHGRQGAPRREDRMRKPGNVANVRPPGSPENDFLVLTILPHQEKSCFTALLFFVSNFKRINCRAGSR